MIGQYFQSRKLKNKNALELIPSKAVESIELEGGKAELLVPRFKYDFMANIFKRSAFFKVKLDETGSKVWKEIDGKKNIAAIVSSLNKKGIQAEDIESRVVDFITNLYRKDLVKFE